jgi:hypothetical protein
VVVPRGARHILTPKSLLLGHFTTQGRNKGRRM